jgi:hypothetical protein
MSWVFEGIQGRLFVPLDFKILRILLPVSMVSSGTPEFEYSNLTGDNLHLGNTVGVTEHDTDLGRSGTLLGQLADLIDNLLRSGLEPCWGSAGVRDRRGRYAFSVGVKSSHFGGCVVDEG